MEEKIKVNIENSVYEILLKDMELFNFYKPNGSLNQNLFFTKVITNYYLDFNLETEKLTSSIKRNLSKYLDLDKKDLINLVSDLTNDLSANSLDLRNKKFTKSISIKPNKQSLSAFKYISKYLLKDTSISNFYRNLFTSYTKMPLDLRERIVFMEEYNLINKAILENKKIFFTLNSANEVSPYQVTSSKEELFNYLLAINNGRVYTYRLSKIKDISIINSPATIRNSDKLLLDKMIELGPQYPIYKEETEDIVVRLTKTGETLFKSIYLHRPKLTKKVCDLYYFNCSYMQIYQYFLRFGRNAVIISPVSLRDKIKYYYLNSFLEYKKEK